MLAAGRVHSIIYNTTSMTLTVQVLLIKISMLAKVMITTLCILLTRTIRWLNKSWWTNSQFGSELLATRWLATHCWL